MGIYLRTNAWQPGLTRERDPCPFIGRVERLLESATRFSGRFWLFSHADLADLAFIRNAQELGFSLYEIHELVGLKNAGHPDCDHVERMLEDKVSAVCVKITALQKLEHELNQAMIRCHANLLDVANGSANHCPNYRVTMDLVHTVLRAEGVQVEVDEVPINNVEDASSHAFSGSPTIRVNDQDIESIPSGQLPAGFACRTCLVDGRPQGVPPRSLLEHPRMRLH